MDSRNVPADGPKLAALLHDAVHVAHDEQQLAPVRPVDCVQHVLQHRRAVQGKGLPIS